MTTQKTYRYMIAGRGEFPVSALFHDKTWPANLEAAKTLSDIMSNPTVMRGWQVMLESYTEPRVQVWVSLGYRIERAP